MVEFLTKHYERLFKYLAKKQSQRHEIIKGKIMYWQTMRGLADTEHKHKFADKCSRKIKKLQKKLVKSRFIYCL